VDRVAQDSLPDVTYMSLKMTVKEVNLSAAAEVPKEPGSPANAPKPAPKKKN